MARSKVPLKLYRYHQNNSGSYYYRDSGVDETVYVEARSAVQANRIADKAGLFDLPYCECCGPRFRSCFEDNAIDDYSIVDVLRRDNVVVYPYRKDPIKGGSK